MTTIEKSAGQPNWIGDMTSEPILVILHGIPGSGKTFFANSLKDQMLKDSKNEWIFVCQDDLGKRSKCEKLCMEALCAGKRVVIDRCNADENQRFTWIKAARDYWPYEIPHSSPIWCISFNTHFDRCVERIKANPNHPTVSPEDAEKICACQAKEITPPQLNEGISCICNVNENDPLFIKELVYRLKGPLHPILHTSLKTVAVNNKIG